MKQVTATHKIGKRIFRKASVSSPNTVSIVLVNGIKETLAETKEKIFAQEKTNSFRFKYLIQPMMATVSAEKV